MRSSLLLFLMATSLSWAQLQSPKEFLGYSLGDAFTRHHEVVNYFQHLANQRPDQVVLQTYGSTNERRSLQVAFIGTPETIAKLESIQADHLRSLTEGEDSDIGIVWLSYNVHGNESVSTEASMQTAYELLTSKSEWLSNTLVVIDPCINPDGRERYVNWYYQAKNQEKQPDPNSSEHFEPWHSGRTNHYVFDLNRDWVWTTQTESKARLALYNQWLPHIHVDFHEQGVDSPYYFAPAAEPIHEAVTKFQKDFQTELGRNHAKYFDKNGWLFFTKERFDLLYPSYGDSYPTFNGAIGMTYEQGGGGRAGLSIYNGDGDAVTLKDRIAHHVTTGLSTVEMAHLNTQRLIDNAKLYFDSSIKTHQTYVLSGKEDNIHQLTKLLDRHKITYEKAQPALVTGYDYRSQRQKRLQIGSDHLLVSTRQFKGSLVRVLFEREAQLNDSVTYDITSWSLPYAYDIEAVEVNKDLKGSSYTATKPIPVSFNENAYAYAMNYDSFEDQKALSFLLSNGARVRTSYEAFEIDGMRFNAGTSIILVKENPNLKELLTLCTDKYSRTFKEVSSGFVTAGKDFGSSAVQLTKAPKIALLKGDGISSYNFGEWWYFLEQDLNLNIATIDHRAMRRVDLKGYDIIIMPSGSYAQWSDAELNRIKTWVREGGRLIAQSDALYTVSNWEGLSLKAKQSSTSDSASVPYALQERSAISERITGAIFETKVDRTHPIAFGYNSSYFSLKLSENYFEKLNRGTIFSIEENGKPVSGFAGERTEEPLEHSLVLGAERFGRGQVVYFVDNPVFRGFWYGAKQAVANALFFEF